MTPDFLAGAASPIDAFVGPTSALGIFAAIIAYIVTQVRLARQQDVGRYKRRAEDAEKQSEVDLRQLEEKVDRLEETVASLRTEQEMARIAHATELREREDRHRAELDAAHERLLVEVRMGWFLREHLVSQHGCTHDLNPPTPEAAS